MEVYFIFGNKDSIRAFAAAQTHANSGLDVAEKYGITLKRVDEVPNSIDYKSKKMVNYLEKWDHYSTREKVQFNFYVEGVSRVLSFWLMTYATKLSFLQQSQRFVDVSNNKKFAISELSDLGFVIENYKKLLKLVPEEDARYLLPQGVLTNFVMSGNLNGFYLAANELMKKKFPNEIDEFVNIIFDAIKKDARFSVEGVLEKIKSNEEPPTDFIYDSYPSKFSSNLEEVLLTDDLKHSYGVFDFELSTAAAHQLIRHRDMNKTILSIGDGYIVPPSILNNEVAYNIFEDTVGVLFDLAKENESQYFYPNAAKVKVKGSENLYEFISSFLALRTCYAAQWEIRAVAMQTKNQLERKIDETLPIGRCFYYSRPSKLSDIFPTRNCPESKKIREKCGIYLNKL